MAGCSQLEVKRYAHCFSEEVGWVYLEGVDHLEREEMARAEGSRVISRAALPWCGASS